MRKNIPYKIKQASAGLLSVGMMLSLTACGSISDKNVSIDKYKGIAVQVTKMEEVEDSDVEDTINTTLEENYTTKAVKKKAEEGDIVNMDYVGYIDGETFENGSAEGYDVEIGSGTLLDAEGDYEGFEDQLIGHKKGETFKVKVQFPEDYGEDSLNGKAATFKVTINQVSEKIIPELTDEWVQEYSNNLGAETAEEYEDAVREQLEEENQEEYDSNLETAVAEALVEKCKIKNEDDHEEEINEIYENYLSYAKSYADYYGVTWDEFLETYIGSTEEEYEETLQEEAVNEYTLLLACDLIAKEEDITLSEKEYQKELEEAASEAGMEADEYEEENDEEELKENYLRNKALDWVVDHAHVYETEDTSSDAEVEYE